MKSGRKQFLIGSLWCGLLFVVVASYATMRAGRNRLNAAQLQLNECEKMATDIQTLQDRPGFAALGIDSPRTITARAEEAGRLASMQPTALVRIEPQLTVRLRDSAYRSRPTRLELRRVTLEQVIAFAHAMTDETQGTTIRDLRLSATEGNADDVKQADLWTAELVLTQLIFSPLAR